MFQFSINLFLSFFDVDVDFGQNGVYFSFMNFCLKYKIVLIYRYRNWKIENKINTEVLLLFRYKRKALSYNEIYRLLSLHSFTMIYNDGKLIEGSIFRIILPEL